jgi:succinate dehydrogenase / fumarate reductase membrane anchor subunit
MVTNVMSLTRNGLLDWLIQRVSALIIGAYAVFLIGFIIYHPGLSFAAWQGLFSHLFMRIFTVIVLFNILFHSWVGMWTVFTDYIKSSCLRLVLEIAMVLVLIVYVVWGIAIVWGI